MAANPADVLGLVYAADYVELGATALVPLSLGTVAFCVLAINGTILNGAGLTRPAIGVAAVWVAAWGTGNQHRLPSILPSHPGHANVLTSNAHKHDVSVGTVGYAIVWPTACACGKQRRKQQNCKITPGCQLNGSHVSLVNNG